MLLFSKLYDQVVKVWTMQQSIIGFYVAAETSETD
jgi:hypothetical protein